MKYFKMWLLLFFSEEFWIVVLVIPETNEMLYFLFVIVLINFNTVNEMRESIFKKIY